MLRTSPIAALALAAALMAQGVGAPAAAAAKCYGWTEAAPIVARLKLVPAAEIHRQARAAGQGELIRITLCEEDGGYVYRLVLQRSGGKVHNMTIDASRPFPR